MLKFAIVFLLAGGAFAQVTQYQMADVSPGFSNNSVTLGPYNAGGRMTATCSSYVPGRYSNATSSTYPLDTGNNIVEIGVILPSGQRVPCNELVSYVASGKAISRTVGTGALKQTIPGLSAGAFSVDWVYGGTVYHRENWAIIYCDFEGNFNDTTAPGQC